MKARMSNVKFITKVNIILGVTNIYLIDMSLMEKCFATLAYNGGCFHHIKVGILLFPAYLGVVGVVVVDKVR